MKDQIVKINTREFKNAVEHIFDRYCKDDRRNITWKDVKVTENGSLISIRGKPFLRHDRHHHFPKKKDHLTALFDYLLAVKEVVEYQNTNGVT